MYQQITKKQITKKNQKKLITNPKNVLAWIESQVTFLNMGEDTTNCTLVWIERE